MMRQHWCQQKLKLRRMSVFGKKNHITAWSWTIFIYSIPLLPPPPPPIPNVPLPVATSQRNLWFLPAKPLHSTYSPLHPDKVHYLLDLTRSQTPANCFTPSQYSYTQPSHHNLSMCYQSLYTWQQCTQVSLLEMGKEIYSGSTMSTCSVSLYTVYSVSAAHVASLS